MKKYILLSILSVIFNAITCAQDTLSISIDSINTEKSFSENMTLMIEPLDKAQIKTGILLDKAFILSSIDEFNGLIDSSIISMSRWKQIYRQLFTGLIIDTLLPSPDSLKVIVNKHIQQNTIPIVIANIKYNSIKLTAIDSNLLHYNNGKLYDVQERKYTPYDEKRFFSIIPFSGQIYQGQFNFKFDNDLIISNTEDSIIKIEVDFDDGLGFVEIGMRQNSENTVKINYNTFGLKVLTFILTFSNKETLVSKCSLNINSISSVQPDNSFSVTGYMPSGGYYGTGTAYVLYGCGNNNQLRKPIIVSDGFDPSNERHFFDYLDNNGTSQMGLYSLLNQNNFIENARMEGFDFVILDYNGGGDYIQRNAQVLISLINNINTQLVINGSTSELIVVGPSMAGLISKYALRYMEDNNLNHNTRMYISFDSPHLGANIPLGDQHWLDFFATYANAQGAIDGRNSLNTPAAQQMLVYHYSSFPYLNPLRIPLFNDPYFNFPDNCRKIAISNGSGNMVNFFSPCEQIIDYSYSVTLLGNVVRGDAFAVPAFGQCRIFEGRIPTQFILGFPTGYTTKTISVSGTQPYDSSPGGSFNVNQTIADGDTDGKGDIFTNFPNHCFIPTVSALAINSISLNENIHGFYNYPFPPYLYNLTPFDAIYAPNYNQSHVLITNENINWIMDEVTPNNLFLQNRILNNNAHYEARNNIAIGSDVDPVIGRQQIGNFITNSSSIINIRAGEEIVLKPGTSIKQNSDVHLFIEEFSCSSNINLRKANNEGETSTNTINFTSVVNNYLSRNDDFTLNIYPNPTINKIFLNYQLAEQQKVVITLLDSKGQQLQKMSLIKQQGMNTDEIDLHNYPKGIYFIRILSQNEFITRQIVKL